MASKKFQRKIREVADEVIEPGEEFRAGIAGQAGAGAIAKAGTYTGVAQMARAGATLSGSMFNALAILTDRHVYLIRTPKFQAFKVSEVVLKEPVGNVQISEEQRSRVRIGDYVVTYMIRMSSDVRNFVELATESTYS